MTSEVEFVRALKQESGPGARRHGAGADGMDPLRQFAGGIVRDFNNLLTVSNGYCQLLLSETRNAGKLTEYASEIHLAGKRAAAIIEMVMAYAGGHAMPKETFDVNALLGNMRGLLTLFLGGSISLNLRLWAQPCPVSVDRGRLQWALMNLITNSKEAMPAGGRLDLETRLCPEDTPEREASGPEAPRIEIRIRDTGYGMTKDVLDRIFEPYFSTKHCSNKPGQGLSLASTSGIVRQMGGRIKAESAPGEGTLVRIHLPVAGPA